MCASLNFRLIATPLAILVCAGSGWWLRAWSEPEGPAPGDAVGASRPPAGPVSQDLPVFVSATAPGASGTAAKNPPAPTALRVTRTLERLFTTDPNDMIDVMEGLGSLTSMTDAEVRLAWKQLSQRIPNPAFGGRLTALYLWARLGRMGEDLPLPPGWGVEDMVVAVASDRARRGGDQSSEKIRERLESGEPVSETERRVIFGQLARASPLDAVKLWCRVTPPGDYERDAPWLVDALTDPATRSAVMAEVRKWQAGGNVAGTTAFLARNWLQRDPAAVAQWLAEPGQADIRSALLPEVVAARAGADPAETWAWAQTLPEQQRRQTLEMSAAHLAAADPEGGMRLIASLPASAARQEAAVKFGEVLAAQDFALWRKWRDTLPSAEQDAVNASAFGSWVGQDAGNAVAWLETRPAGPVKDALVTVLIETYANEDPEGAARWLASIPDPARREEAFQSALVMTGFNNLERVKILLGGLVSNNDR